MPFTSTRRRKAATRSRLTAPRSRTSSSSPPGDHSVVTTYPVNWPLRAAAAQDLYYPDRASPWGPSARTPGGSVAAVLGPPRHPGRDRRGPCHCPRPRRTAREAVRRQVHHVLLRSGPLDVLLPGGGPRFVSR